MSEVPSIQRADQTLSTLLRGKGAPPIPRYPPAHHEFVEIGKGGCGHVYAFVDGMVLKKGIKKYDPSDTLEHSLLNDFRMHWRVWKAFGKLRIYETLVPEPLNFHPANETNWWEVYGKCFPAHAREPSDIIEAQRILPLSRGLQDAMIDLYCQDALKEQARASLKNKDCLVMPILGRRRDKVDAQGRMLKYPAMLNLRNFELCVDQMEALSIDVLGLCKSFARALAVMHYVAKVDANDVEFLFGAAPARRFWRQWFDLGNEDAMAGPTEYCMLESRARRFNRPVHLWLIDFNMCRPIEVGPGFVDQAIRAFHGNSKPFWPRPRCDVERQSVSGRPPGDAMHEHRRAAAHVRDMRYWKQFKDEYIRYSRMLIDSSQPEEFMNALEDFYKKRQQGQAEASQRSQHGRPRRRGARQS